MAEKRRLVVALVSRLPAREQRIVWLRFAQDLTQQEIAVELGISQMHVSRLLARILETLRRAAADDGRSPQEQDRAAGCAA